MEVLIRYFHFIGILLLSGTLMVEFALLKPAMTRAQLCKLSWVDAVLGLGALIVLTAGLLLWFHGEKSSAFYSRNPVFMTKISLFGIIALASIYPTVFFLQKRKGVETEVVRVPALVRWIVKMELALIFLLPLLAVLMARGIGLAP